MGEMMRVNIVDDLTQQSHLGGLVFKRKALDPTKLKGVGCFGLAGFTYAYYPQMVMHFGSTLTTLTMGFACLAGMNLLGQRDPIVNTIGVLSEGEHAGKLEITIQESLVGTRTIIVHSADVMGLASLGNDDVGEDDFESNIISVQNFLDVGTGETVGAAQFILPADSYRDVKTLDWILSIKNVGDSTLDSFNDLMNEEFARKSAAPKLSTIQL